MEIASLAKSQKISEIFGICYEIKRSLNSEVYKKWALFQLMRVEINYKP